MKTTLMCPEPDDSGSHGSGSPQAPASAGTAHRYGDGTRYDSGARYDEDPPPSVSDGGARVKLELTRRNDADLLQLATQHIAAMTGNPNFPTPLPAAAAFQAAVDDFGAKLTTHNNAAAAAREATTLKEQSRRALQALFTQRGEYVNIASNGDAAIIQSAALPVRSSPTPVGILPPPQNLRIELNGVAGEMHLKWDPVPYADGYLVQCSEDVTPRQWGLNKTLTKAKLLLDDMFLGKTYVFRLATVGGSSGQSPWSPEVKRGAA